MGGERAWLRGRRWADLSRGERTQVAAWAAVQVTLQLAALRDIKRRPAEQINGSKRAWTVAALFNVVGPLAYFLVGRKR